MTKFNFDYSDDATLNYGNQDAKTELTLILNLGCPDTRDWFNANKDDLEAAIDDGKLKIHVKFWNKDKEDLANGNVANGYVDYDDPKAAWKFIVADFENQDELDAQNLADVPAYLADKFGVKQFADRETVAAKTLAEVEANDIVSVPTVIKGDEAYFDDSLKTVTELLG
ncbi:thioredoxin domain-containing protein [Lentilactobacillus sp. Marseille-Q4993]|uniref:thioredoxin domain-containing protein n=1 Tax=Lentilactobacillus sp. Marseille-Q4993 TaxID=3039492 RepID=UPI0024BD410C|nr:thioredoxin domain-containing protein [Lentilactobacillus sp. Marseille-Q4993]